ARLGGASGVLSSTPSPLHNFSTNAAHPLEHTFEAGENGCMASFTDTLTHLGDLSVPFAPTPAVSLADAELLQAQRSLAEVQRRVQSQAAVLAAEIAHRSRRELGHSGLAATQGRRSAEELI